MELLVSFLKNPKFDIRPLVKVIGSDILPLTKEIEWGYRIPYMLTGTLNQHPLDAMELMDLPDDDKRKIEFDKFYNQITD